MTMRMLPVAQVTSQYWAFRGGLDQTSPSISVPPGRCRAATNVEVGPEGGLTVTMGYERFSGQSKPSDAAYHVMVVNITGAAVAGDTITGVTSAATGVLIAVTATEFIFTKLSGTFTAAETINISGSPVATVTSASSQGAASTRALDATYKNLAADEYRGDIAAPAGSGNILGVWKFASTAYCVRNNAGATAAVLYKETSSGWAAVNLGREVAFTSGGTYEILAGNTITGATSGATAVVGRVVVTSGTWGAGTAAGFLYFPSQTGTLQAENLNVGANLNVATIAANSSAVTLTASGRYEFINHNFGGSGGMNRMYGVSGVHKAFEFDGTNFAFITTGMTADTPSHVAANKGHLFLSFGASVQHSGTLDPLSWSVVLGAGEIGMGENVTSFLHAPGGTTGGALIIYTRNSTSVLYGNDVSDWNLVPFNPDAGAIEWTAQYISQGVVLDDRGVTLMATSQAFGNFKDSDISAPVRPYVNALRSSAVASCAVREKNQYRLFFSGGDALYVTFIGGKVAGLMPVTLTDAVTCICSLEAADGVEEIFFGSDNGMVYQMEKGTSHDGEALAWSAELAYNHFGSPLQLKQFRKAVVEVSGEGYCVFSMAANIAYGSTNVPQGATSTITTSLNPAVWDSFTWDAFFWDGVTLTPSEADLDGTAENISLIFSGNSDEFSPITLNGAIVSFTPRRLLR
jgi:hypothetical protein